MQNKTTLEQWKALQAVVDYGGYAQAAEALHRSQSSISYLVSKLQAQLGVPLLQVEGRKAQLTSAGQVLLERSRHLLQEAGNLEALAQTLESGWEAEINLVAEAALPSGLLMQVLSDFQSRARGTRIRLREVILSGAEEALLEGKADLVITPLIPAQFLGDALLELEFVAVAHPEHPLHQLQRKLNTADLGKHVHVIISDSGSQKSLNSGWLGAEQRWTVSNLSSAVAAVRHGLGFSWLPRHQIAEQLASGQLRSLPLEEGQCFTARLHLVFGKAERSGPATRLLAELFHQHARGFAAQASISSS